MKFVTLKSLILKIISLVLSMGTIVYFLIKFMEYERANPEILQENEPVRIMFFCFSILVFSYCLFLYSTTEDFENVNSEKYKKEKIDELNNWEEVFCIMERIDEKSDYASVVNELKTKFKIHKN